MVEARTQLRALTNTDRDAIPRDMITMLEEAMNGPLIKTPSFRMCK